MYNYLSCIFNINDPNRKTSSWMKTVKLKAKVKVAVKLLLLFLNYNKGKYLAIYEFNIEFH